MYSKSFVILLFLFLFIDEVGALACPPFPSNAFLLLSYSSSYPSDAPRKRGL
jgi:hypothetical protein